MVTRRNCLVMAGAAALSIPLSAVAQQPRTWRVGILSTAGLPTPPESDPHWGAFVGGMRDLGYAAGRNVHYEWRIADGKFERLPGLAAELVARKVDIIIASSTPATRAVQHATKEIPVVIVSVGDPVGTGIVASLARPGANITGMANLSVDIDPKRLEMLLAAVPSAARISAMLNPANPTYPLHAKTLRVAAEKAKVQIQVVDARTREDIARCFAAMAKARAQGAYIQQDSLFTQHREHIAQLAVAARLPTIFGSSEYANAGGLLSYGPDLVANYRHIADFVHKIFNGAKPAELPIEQPTELELVVNLKTAKAIGMTLPAEIMFRARRVIE